MATEMQIQTMSREEVDLAIEWAAREGWNPGLSDAQAFHAADPEGLLIGRIAGEPVAICSAVRHGETFGFIGCYIVAPHLRGRGYGLQIWKVAMQRLQGRCIGLDGVIEQQHNYARSGFNLAYRQVRYAGRVQAAGLTGSAQGTPSIQSDRLPSSVVSDLSAVPVSDWLRYDRACFPSERRPYIEAWVRQPGTVALASLREGKLAGYGAIRPARQGYKIGPLFAEDSAVAAQLLDGLQARVTEGSELFIDIPLCNEQAVQLVEQRGMKPVFETARMYTGGAPNLNTQAQFGVTSFELG